MNDPGELRTCLLAHLPESSRVTLAAWDGLAPLLADTLATARQRWPGVQLEVDAFARHLARPIDAAEDPILCAEQLHGADLYLACACSQADPPAMQLFERDLLPAVEASLRRFCHTPDDSAELRGQLLDRLFVAEPGGQPRIATYEGRGHLLGWLRVVATRVAIDWTRQRRVDTTFDDAGRAAEALEKDPELAMLEAGYREAFRRAVRQAIDGLSDRQKTLLRYHLIDRLSIDRIAALYRVDRSTAARWLQAVRERIFKLTRADLMRQLQVDEEEFDSIVRLLHSRMDVTLRSLL